MIIYKGKCPDVELADEQRVSIEEWLVNMRSGKFKQGQDYLHKGDSYCCLGIACEIKSLNNKIDVHDVHTYIFNDDGESYSVPDLEWWRKEYGFNFSHTFFGTLITLSRMNDKGISFHLIATVVETMVLHQRPLNLIHDNGKWRIETPEN